MFALMKLTDDLFASFLMYLKFITKISWAVLMFAYAPGKCNAVFSYRDAGGVLYVIMQRDAISIA